MRLPAPGANNSGAPKPPLGIVIDEVGLNSISPPFNASTRGWPKPFGQLRVTPLAMIVASSAIIAMAPPPVFPALIPLRMIVVPLIASSHCASRAARRKRWHVSPRTSPRPAG
jgi:hypothetical protein